MNTFDPDKFEKQSHPYTIKRLSPSIGAELLDLDLKEPLSENLKNEIYQALLVYKVIFFRDQDLTLEEHLKFAKNFGELEIHPFTNNHKKYPEVLKITHNEENKGRENTWHSDVTWRLEPSLGSVLRMKKAPKVGGDTLFSDMYAAYEDLSDEIKEKLDGAVAVHDFANFRNRLEKIGVSKEEIEGFNRKYPKPKHPVIRTHPDTNRKLIFVNAAFTEYIEDWDSEESSKMLKFLYSRAATPEYQCRFAWKNNSIAFWDNRSVQHYAASDYWPQVRKVERVTIIGDRPR